MRLIGNADRAAKGAATQAESQRLAALPVRELAAEVMPAFGPSGIDAKSGHRQGPMEVVAWMLPHSSGKFRQPILGPVIEALGVLEHSDLVTRRSFGSRGTASTYHASRLGETALSEGTVRTQLGLAPR
jgi:hypothetical protein